MTAPPASLAQSLRQSFAVLPQRRRWQCIAVLGLMLVGALAELVTIGAVLPFLALIANPHAADSHPSLARLLGLLGVSDRLPSLAALAGLFCAVAVIAALVRMLLSWASQRFVFRLGYDLSVALYGHILDQPYSFHVANNASKTLAAIEKVQRATFGFFMPLMQLVTSGIIAIFIFAGLVFISAPVALAAAAGFGLTYLLVSVVTRHRLRQNSRAIATAYTERIQTVQEGLGGIRDVILDRAQRIYLERFGRFDSRLRDAQATNALIASAPRFVVEGMGMVLIAVLALILNRQAGGLAVALPVLGALALGAQRLLPLLQQIYNGWAMVLTNQSALDDVLELLSHPTAEAVRAEDTAPVAFETALVLDKVSFRYAEDRPLVLRDVSLTIPKGARVGFVGETGSGKSTLVDLILGLLSPSAGTIWIDGEPLRPANTRAWQAKIAHVPQHIYLSDATIIENIAFGAGRPAIDEARAHLAARHAQVDSFITEQPLGYDALVGERGVRLSGGQRQRIGIARALYKHAAVLVLDEATSALDDATETAVMAAINALGQELTVLMIAHRVTTLRGCDIIFRLDHGEIVESGSYAEVIGDKDLLHQGAG